ncbi:type II toxin-antitoxin system PemK/MazF family toxin [Legionella beliardensis]|uniref:type II toxin-antitoxin system PemK/MazF family toxin n=1 Tax=Legionella beliardensis TaxID=91822 RepID=UPI001A951898
MLRLKKRPVLIISNNANNNAAKAITIISITSNITKVYPFEVLLEKSLTGLAKDSKAQCHQIRTISKLRISNIKPPGMINEKIMNNIVAALKLHLDIVV